MLAETTQKTKTVWKTVQEPEYKAYIPSLLMLIMAVDNGWDITSIEMKPSHDQHGFVYLVTVKCRSNSQFQRLVIPQSKLVEKIFEQYAPSAFTGCQ
jgi:hypothetical protein